MTTSIVRLALVGVALAAVAACAPRPAPQGAVETPAQNNPVYNGGGGTNVDGGAIAPVRPGSEQDFVVNVGDRVYFDLDSYQVKPEAYARLNAQAQWLQRYPGVRVRIEGNADERGTREYNIALGSRRASAVRDYLVGLGVSPSRISTVSFGKERPIDPGADDEAFRRNRNAHTAIVSGAR